MGRNQSQAKIGRRTIHVVPRSVPRELTTIIEITGNESQDRSRADGLSRLATYESQLAYKGIIYALEQRLPKGEYEARGYPTNGQITLTPYGR